MTYDPPTDPLAVDLDLNVQYTAITDPAAVDFDLAAGGSGIVYPIPPGIMVSSTLSVSLTSSAPSGSAGLGYSMTPAQKAVRRALRSAMASQPFGGRSGHGWDRVPVKDEPIGDGIQPWGTAGKKEPRATGSGWDSVPVKDDRPDEGLQPWDGSISPVDGRTGQGYNVPALKDVANKHPQADSAKYWEWPHVEEVPVYIASGDFNLTAAPYTLPAHPAVDFNLVPEAEVEILVPTRPLFSGRDLQGWTTNTPADIRYRHPWDDKPRKGTEVDFDYGQEEPLPGEPPEEPETKRTYIIMNSSSLVTVSDNTPLQFADLSMELDADSFAWSMSCTILNKASMDKILPDTGGPAEVIATVNGWQWRFLVDRYSLDRRFAREQYQIRGVSRSQLLAAPYAPKRTGRIESPTNMAQVMAQQLEFTGFTVELQQGLYDYVIPAGAWGYDNKTAMEVITELAVAVGAVVVPDRMNDVLHIRHRYKQTPPWYYSSLTETDIDSIIQDSMRISYASQWEPQPEYNFVFVSGVTDGVAVSVVRNGTAGDKPAQDIFDDLNVEAQQCRLRGMTALSASGNQEIVSVDTFLPTSGSPGLVEPAMLLELRDTREPDQTWRGNSLSTRISVTKPGAGRVIQTVKVERHHY